MWLLEKINKEDICKVIAYSQNIENPQIDKLLDNWDKQEWLKPFSMVKFVMFIKIKCVLN